MPIFEYVIAVENNAYMAWQAKLFHWSCLEHVRQAPIIMVMGQDGDLQDDLRMVNTHRGVIQRTENHRSNGYAPYAARNTPGALLDVRTDADYIVLCDSDMIFIREPPWSQFEVDDDQISFDAVEYMRCDHSSIRPYIRDACTRANVPYDTLQEYLGAAGGGVPHIVPVAQKQDLAREWLRCLELFLPQHGRDSIADKIWIASMWGLVLAAFRLNLSPVRTHMTETNSQGSRPLKRRWSMIHYLYGNDIFDKRKVRDRSVNTCPGDSGSIDEAICEQVRASTAWYGGETT